MDSRVPSDSMTVEELVDYFGADLPPLSEDDAIDAVMETEATVLRIRRDLEATNG